MQPSVGYPGRRHWCKKIADPRPATAFGQFQSVTRTKSYSGSGRRNASWPNAWGARTAWLYRVSFTSSDQRSRGPIGRAQAAGGPILSGRYSMPTIRWHPVGVAPSPSRLSSVRPPRPMVQGKTRPPNLTPAGVSTRSSGVTASARTSRLWWPDTPCYARSRRFSAARVRSPRCRFFPSSRSWRGCL